MATEAGRILREAADVVDGPRNEQHGDKQASFEGMALAWNAYLENAGILSKHLTAEDVAAMMVLLKMTRTQYGRKIRDHYVDLCGYGAIMGQLSEGLDSPAAHRHHTLLKCRVPGCPLGRTGADGEHCQGHQEHRSAKAGSPAAHRHRYGEELDD